MSHVFPPRVLRPGMVVDPDDFDENVRAFKNEARGRLGEQNFKEEAFPSRASLEFGAGLRHYRRGLTVDGSDWTATPTGTFIVKKTPTWQPVDDMTLTFTSGAALLWIMASFQASGKPLTSLFSPTIFQAALRIDGATLVNGLTGDPDVQEAQEITFGDGADVTLDGDRYMRGVGIAQFNEPVVVEAMVPVGPGLHTIDLVARPLWYPASGDAGRIYTRTLIVLEFHQ